MEASSHTSAARKQLSAALLSPYNTRVDPCRRDTEVDEGEEAGDELGADGIGRWGGRRSSSACARVYSRLAELVRPTSP